MRTDRLIPSPLNYTGGKYKLLPQIFRLFPDRVRYFVDLFCGGACVGVNADCNRVILNDTESRLIRILEMFRNHPFEVLVSKIGKIIDKYGLSRVNEHGYEFYGCNGGDGLGAYNKHGFNLLRTAYNSSKKTGVDDSLMLYVLIVYSFNNQIRFNNKGDFNLPVGKRDFNGAMRHKLQVFSERMKSIDCELQNVSFVDFDIRKLYADDFVYADPPYLVTCASYNENGGWSSLHELALYEQLERIDARGIPFALSNVLLNKGKANVLLEEWLDRNPRFICHHLDHSYSNSNYHAKDKESSTDEVLITNY